MTHEFSRAELLVGEDGLKRWRESVVMVLGIGGVGSHCVEALARGGIGKLILVDNDVVSFTNMNRQSIAFHSTVGKYKTKVMQERIKDICPETEVETYELFVLPENMDALFEQKIDYIVDAIDTVTAKIALVEKATEYQIPIISCMGTGNKLHGEQLEVADISKTSVCPLCRVMRKELKARGIKNLKVVYSKEKPLPAKGMHAEEDTGTRRSIPGSVSFVPPVAGLLMAGEVMRDLLGEET